MYDVRVIYRKQDRARYISHLDVNRLMLRALKRSRLPVWHTEGYNPRIFVSFALPLSLGFVSDYEIMDLRLNEQLSAQQIKQTLQASLPESFSITEVFTPVLKAKELCFASFCIDICTDSADKVRSFLNQPSIELVKITKKGGEKRFDVKPLIQSLDVAERENGLVITLTLPAGNESNINPMLIFESMMAQEIALEVENICRTGVYDKNMQLFR